MRIVAGLALLVVFAGSCQSGTPRSAASESAGQTSTVANSSVESSAGSGISGSAGLPAYTSSVREIGGALADRMATSWRAGCPVPLTDLRYVTVRHVDFSGAAQDGELVVRADVAEAVTRIFGTLYDARYPIRSLRLVDDFGGSDDDSMAADNSSAFNCRPVTGGGGWSEHSYGTAIDLNPVENPYLVGGTVLPPAGSEYVDRPDRPGVIHPDDEVVTAFAAEGWSWGGTWTDPIDYQHFSLSGH